MSVRTSAEEAEALANNHKRHANWLSAAGAFIAAGVWWRRLRDLRRAQNCLRAAAAALDREADRWMQLEEQMVVRRKH